MYLIIDKKTKAILHMSNSFPGEDLRPEQLFPAFDPETMEFGRAPGQYIPARFAIENGVVKDLDSPPPAPAETIAKARARTLRAFSDQALSLRQQLIPDYQLLNAGIGLYDEERTQSYQNTIQAFRDEYRRLEGLVAKAKSVKELEAIEPSFPKALVAPKTKKPR